MSDEEIAFDEGSEGVVDEEVVGEEGDGSPCSKMGSACGCMIFGMLLFPAMLYLLGWNEQAFVCNGAKLMFAESDAVDVPAAKCSQSSSLSEYANQFVFFSCPIEQSTLREWTPADFGTSLSTIKFKSPAARQFAEIYQCMEHAHEESRTEYRNGKKVTVKTTTYTYSLGWSSSIIDHNSFRNAPTSDTVRRGCGSVFNGNGQAPVGVQLSNTATKTSSSVNSGVFSLSAALRSEFSANVVVNLESYRAQFTGGAPAPGPAPAPNVAENSMVLLSDGATLATCHQVLKIGCVNIRYYEADVTHVSVLANVDSSGNTAAHPTPSSWGCSASSLEEMKFGALTKAETLKELHSENQTRTWILRAVGCIGAWLAIYLCLSPISAAADIVGDCLDFIPCIGDTLESLVEGVVTTVLCVMSCGIGCSCALFVISIVWVAMRPVVGGIMLGAAILLFVLAGVVRSQYQVPDGAKRRKKRKAQEEEPAEEEA